MIGKASRPTESPSSALTARLTKFSRSMRVRCGTTAGAIRRPSESDEFAPSLRARHRWPKTPEIIETRLSPPDQWARCSWTEPTTRIMGLEVRGWRKGEAQDAGWVWDMWKPLPGHFEVTFGIEGGLCMGAPDMNPATQKLDGVRIAKVAVRPHRGQRERSVSARDRSRSRAA